MELSPLAKERLARIGNLSPEESKLLELNRKLESLLSQYFTDIITSEDLWKKVKELKEQRGSTVPAQAQVKLLNSLRSNVFSSFRNSSNCPCSVSRSE